MLTRWPAFTRFLDDGRICLSNNAAERALRGIALGRRAWLFAGSDRGGERAAAMYTLIATVVAGRAAVHSLGEAGCLGAPTRSRRAARHRAWHDLSRRHQHPGSPQGGGRTKKGVDSRQRDVREALGRSRGGYGTKACVIADERRARLHSRLRRVRRMNCRLPRGCSAVCRTCPGGLSVIGALPPMPFASASGTWAYGPPSRPGVPTRPSRPREWIYNNRHLVENLWARLKQWRAVATRYDKTAHSFLKRTRCPPLQPIGLSH